MAEAFRGGGHVSGVSPAHIPAHQARRPRGRVGRRHASNPSGRACTVRRGRWPAAGRRGPTQISEISTALRSVSAKGGGEVKRSTLHDAIQARGGRPGLRRHNVVSFYRACKRFAAGQVREIGFVGKVRDLRLVLSAVASSGPDRPDAA